jgi:hypothetical protein
VSQVIGHFCGVQRKARGSALRHFHRDAHWAARIRGSFQIAWFEAQAAGDSDYLVCGAENTRAAGKAAGLESEPCATTTLARVVPHGVGAEAALG